MTSWKPSLNCFSSEYHAAAAAAADDDDDDDDNNNSDNNYQEGGSVAEWLACWTQLQKGPGSDRIAAATLSGNSLR